MPSFSIFIYLFSVKGVGFQDCLF